MKKALVVIALLGCNDRQAKPDPIVAPTDPATVAPVATEPASPSSTPSVAPSVAPSVTGTVTPPEKLPRQTTDCNTDLDCALTSYQSGCCAQACGNYATNAARLAEITRLENCAAVRPTKVCPPPAPCPQAKPIPKKAVCRKGTCEVVY